MAIKGVGLVSLTVSDIKKAKEFFIDKLGLKLCSDDSQYSWLEIAVDDCCPMPVIGVGEENPQQGPFKAGTNGLISFIVDDVSAERTRLEKAGVKFFGPIQEIPGHVKLALFVDDSGNQFFLVEDLSGRK